MVIEPVKSGKYAELKTRIKNGLTSIASTWVQVGEWLEEIKREKLYLHDRKYPGQTWEEFCKRVAGFSRRTADQHIQASKSHALLGEVFGNLGRTLPKISEDAVIEVAKIEPAKRVEVIERAAAATGPLTVARIKAALPAVARQSPAAPAPRPEPPGAQTPAPSCCPTCRRPF